MSDYHELPILRLELQSAKLALSKVLDERNDELKHMISEALDKGIPEIQRQLDSMVYVAVLSALRDRIEEAAQDSICKISDEAAAKLKDAIEKAFREA